jgi:2-polyprenyl-6-methoxyphenol hydroxylase-like FAD-dependent oxidoreductase
VDLAMLGEHAVVLGASMTGLMTARVLADCYERVTVVERDQLPSPGHTRKGVPQARHAHLLLPRGAEAMGDLFPGLLDSLVREGVPVTDEARQFQLTFGGHLLAQDHDTTFPATYQVSRALLEGRVLERLQAEPRVEVLEGYDVVGLATDAGPARAGAAGHPAERVTGARVQRRSDGQADTLHADLVVAATGRGSRAGQWLEAAGHERPVEERLQVDLMYVSCLLRMPYDVLGSVRTVLTGPVPERPTGIVLCAQENGTWILTVSGYAGHHPPTQWPELVASLDTWVPDSVVAVIEGSERLTPLHTHRYPASLRRRYDRLARFPDGFLVIGDAVCSFNPIYGQGMTVAALEAQVLRRCLRAGTDRLARRFFKRIAKPSGAAWQLATGGDLALPTVPGPRPLVVKVLNTYVDRVQAAAEQNPAVATTFLRVTSLLDPPSRLLSPTTVVRVVAARVSPSPPSAA